MLDLGKSLKVLESYGLPVVKSLVISDAGRVKGLAGRVVKANSSIHKSEAGGVLINPSISKVKSLIKRFGSVIVQPLINGREVIVGVKKDAVFGQVVMVGLGGVITELINDFSLRVCPVSKREALSMINELRTKPLLTGYRGAKGVSVGSLVELIVNVSRLAVKHDFKELDLNPVFVNDEGSFIVDARLSF